MLGVHILSAVFPTDLGNELFLAAKVVGNTLGTLVEKMTSTQGIEYLYTLYNYSNHFYCWLFLFQVSEFTHKEEIFISTCMKLSF